MLPKIIACPPFDVDSEQCPGALKLVLREQIRQVFKLRLEFQTRILSNDALDVYIDLWWKNHRSIIRAASIRSEWNWSTLSLVFDENVMRPVNFYRAQRDYLTLLARPDHLLPDYFKRWNFSSNSPVEFSPSYDMYLGENHTLLYKMFVYLFNTVVLEDVTPTKDSVYTDKDAKLSKENCEAIQKFINEHTEEADKRSFFARKFSALFGVDFVPFNKIPKFLFDYAVAHLTEYSEKFSHVSDLILKYHEYFEADVFKSIGAHQLSNDVGPVKTTLTNKLVKLFYDWLTALTIGYGGNSIELETEQPFDYYVNRLKNSIYYFTDEQFKIRDNETGGFRLVNCGTFEQMFARLQENVRGNMSRESFIVSFHPCDMITCSLGYNWSSCQSFIDNFTDFPSGYGTGSTYHGTYNRGNFQFSAGNGFIAYVPYEKLSDRPQFLWAKLKRCLLWVSNDLNCMRQNFFYPGKPSDQETLAFAKVIREYIQNICAPFNFSNGTIDWKSCSKQVRYVEDLDDSSFIKFRELKTYNSGRYDDPILTVSYLKGTKDGELIYANDFPAFDTGRLGNVYFKYNSTNVCPVCGKLHSHEGLCDKCASELVEHNGVMTHPSNLLKIVVDGETKYFDYTELDQLNDYVAVEDGTHVPFKSAFKVFMPSGIKYFKVLPDYVKQCKVCGEYFHKNYMVGEVCIDHINTVLDDNLDIKIDFDVVLDSFLNSTLSFACNDTEALRKLLNILDNKDVKWQSGKNPSEYIPSSRISLGRFLSCDNKKLIVSSQAKSSVVKLSKLFEKGGE